MKLETGGNQAIFRWRQSEAILGSKCWEGNLVTPVCHCLQGLNDTCVVGFDCFG